MNSTKCEAIKHQTKDLKVSDLNGYEEVHFPTQREVKIMDDQNLLDSWPIDGALSLALIRLAAMSFHVPVSLISVTEWIPFFIGCYYCRTVLSGNPLGIVEPLLLSSISSLQLTPVMGFKGEFSKP